MNNYNLLEQKLHQLALSFSFMREATFDIENSFISPSQQIDNHVFIAGLARSGTTILLNALYESQEFASLSYQDMPFVLAPNLWSKLSFNKKDFNSVERAHGDGIKVSKESPEAFEEVFWMTFNDKKNESSEKFKAYIQLIIHKYHKKRYLSKNNQNIRRLELISKIFPNSKIFIPYRDPIQQAYSLLNQHNKFIEDSNQDNFISKYMKWIGHSEFGPNYTPIHRKKIQYTDDLDINHWIEQWYLTYKSCFETLKDKSNVNFICYEKLCKSKDHWSNILKILNIKENYDFTFQESQKEICIDYDNQISNKALYVYSQLYQLNKN